MEATVSKRIKKQLYYGVDCMWSGASLGGCKASQLLRQEAAHRRSGLYKLGFPGSTYRKITLAHVSRGQIKLGLEAKI